MRKIIPKRLLTKEQLSLLNVLKKKAQKVSKNFGGDPSKVKLYFIYSDQNNQPSPNYMAGLKKIQSRAIKGTGSLS